MNNIQQIVRLINPIIKGLPLIIILVLSMIFIASKMVFYATPLYESTGKLKLEDVNMGISNTNLFKSFDVFTQPNKIIAEVEVIKSKELLKKTLMRLPFDVSYYRIGKIRTTELFYDSPFKVKYKITNDRFYEKEMHVSMRVDNTYTLHFMVGENSLTKVGKVNQPIQLEGLEFTILRNDSLLKEKPHIKFEDEYAFIIHSKEHLVNEVSKDLDVKEMDKDIPVVRIIYKHAVPEKAMILVNTHMETYILDGIDMKRSIAERTVDFIDGQMLDVSKKLRDSEYELENYRLAHHITNTRMEVETGLKKIAEMKIQLANLEMNLASLEEIDKYVNSVEPDHFLTKAPNFEGYGGLLYTELIKRLKTLQSDRKELLEKYTSGNEKVKNVDSDIQDVIEYITKNIANARKSMKLQRDNIQKSIIESEKEFIDVPTKEKELVILERNFQLNQAIYNFLTEKRTESAIVEAATMSFHRVIQRAELPEKPVSPKKTFTILVFGFLGLLMGITLSYVYDAISARIKYKDQLEKVSSCAVIGDIRHEHSKGESMIDFLGLASRLRLKITHNYSYTISSGIDGEGKTFVARHLAEAFAQMGIKTLLVDSDIRTKSITHHFDMNYKSGFSEYMTGNEQNTCVYATTIENLTVMPSGTVNLIPEAIFAIENFYELISSLKENYKVVIFDSPSFDTCMDALSLIKYSNETLYVFRANFSKTKLAIEPDILCAEYNFNHIKLLLNDVADFAKMKKDKGIRKTLQIWMKKQFAFTKLRRKK